MTATHPFTTTAFELPGYRITKNFGVVRGIIVRSRSVVGNLGAGIQSLFGGNITIYTELCEQARDDAFRDMISHANALTANAVIGVRTMRPKFNPALPRYCVMAPLSRWNRCMLDVARGWKLVVRGVREP